MKIVANQDCVVKSNVPNFKYKFKSGKPVEVAEEHSAKILISSTFKKVKK